jgi:hypothetical protein
MYQTMRSFDKSNLNALFPLRFDLSRPWLVGLEGLAQSTRTGLCISGRRISAGAPGSSAWAHFRRCAESDMLKQRANQHRCIECMVGEVKIRPDRRPGANLYVMPFTHTFALDLHSPCGGGIQRPTQTSGGTFTTAGNGGDTSKQGSFDSLSRLHLPGLSPDTRIRDARCVLLKPGVSDPKNDARKTRTLRTSGMCLLFGISSVRPCSMSALSCAKVNVWGSSGASDSSALVELGAASGMDADSEVGRPASTSGNARSS